jgi:hypothetical protein
MPDLTLKVSTYTDNYGTDISIDVDHEEPFATPEEAEAAIARYHASLIEKSPEVATLRNQVAERRGLLRRVRYGTDAFTEEEVEDALRG